MLLNRFQMTSSLLLSVLLVGCGAMPNVDDILPDKKVEYKKAKNAGENLEVPPDLTRSSINDSLIVPDATGRGSATLSGQMEKERIRGRVVNTTTVMPKIADIKVKRDAGQRWLEIKGSPEDVWFKTVEFWQDNGILLVQQDPTVGVMLTDWLENRADIRDDIITNTIRKAFDSAYSTSTRDQYRVRLDEGAEPGTTELYLTHRGMEEKYTYDGGGNIESTVWTPRDTDHSLEAEMMRRLMNFMGITDQQARTSLAVKGAKYKPRSKLNRSSTQVSLIVDEELARTWRLAGVALDRVGFAVEDRDRSRWLYFVSYNDPMQDVDEPGLLEKLAFWRDADKNIDKETQYIVGLKPVGATTEILVLNKDGQLQNSETALRILTLLHEQIR